MATEIDLSRLNKRVTALSDALAKLGKGTDGKDLLLILKKPGWTTIAELAFTHAMIDVAEIQMKGLMQTMAGLKGAAAKVAPQTGDKTKKAPGKKAAAKKA